MGVTDSHSGVTAHQYESNWLATNIAASHNYGAAARDRDTGLAQHREYGIGGTLDKAGKAQHEGNGITRAKAINVLLRKPKNRHNTLPDIGKEWQQQHNAI